MTRHLVTLVTDTAVRSFVSWTVGFTMGVLIVGNVKRVLAQLRDKLDENTPGGIADIVDEQRETNRLLKGRK